MEKSNLIIHILQTGNVFTLLLSYIPCWVMRTNLWRLSFKETQFYMSQERRMKLGIEAHMDL